MRSSNGGVTKEKRRDSFPLSQEERKESSSERNLFLLSIRGFFSFLSLLLHIRLQHMARSQPGRPNAISIPVFRLSTVSSALSSSMEEYIKVRGGGGKEAIFC